MFYNVADEQKSRSVFARISENFRHQARKHRALEYLRKWEKKFWITMDQNIKEITETYERKFHAEFGSEIEKFRAGGQYDKRLGVERKSEIVARFRKIVSSEQLAELSGVIEMLSEEAEDESMKKFYILIDRLDERWVDVTIRFRSIRGLIEALRSFRKITNLKIVAAIRSDILERVLQETGDLNFQREKFDEYFCRLRWTDHQLKELVNKRIRFLFRKQYTKEDVSFDDLFLHKVGNQDPFQYILERTLMRPRDVISFVNECLAKSDGKTEISARTIRDAEIEFSRIRRRALEDEWRSAFPTLPFLLDFISGRKNPGADLTELLQGDGVDKLALKIAGKRKIDFDPLYELAEAVSSEESRVNFLKHVISTLYRVGAVGIKFQPSERFRYSHIDQPVIDPATMNDQTRIRIHAMLHRALNIG